MRRERLIPIIVATALFVENTDSTVLATALPTIAADLGQDPVALKLALTSYLVSVAIFIPVSGWMADRFGSRNVFRAALAVFMLGSLACATVASLPGFVLARFVQGLGGAMMVPVGRLVILRSVPRGELVGAMAWMSMPALLGPVIGPPIGGLVTTVFGWRWIFVINLPVGLLGLILATRFMADVREPGRRPLDVLGFLTFGTGLALLMLGFSSGGRHLVPIEVAAGAVGGGMILVGIYVRHALRTGTPLVDLRLLAIPTLRDGLIGGLLFRVGVGAIPFLLPLMLQLGWGLNPLQSGLLTFATAVGALAMKGMAAPILRRFGFRPVLVWNALVASASIVAIGLFSPSTPTILVLAILLVGGCFRSLQFTSINTIVYADVPADRMSGATSLVSVTQPVALAVGIAVGAGVLQATSQVGHGTELSAGDFWPAFLAVGTISAASVVFFARLDPDAGAEMAGRAVTAAKPRTDGG